MAKRKIPQDTTTLFLRQLPTNLKAQFKAACARRGVSMTESIIAYMTEYAYRDRVFRADKEPIRVACAKKGAIQRDKTHKRKST